MKNVACELRLVENNNISTEIAALVELVGMSSLPLASSGLDESASCFRFLLLHPPPP